MQWVYHSQSQNRAGGAKICHENKISLKDLPWFVTCEKRMITQVASKRSYLLLTHENEFFHGVEPLSGRFVGGDLQAVKIEAAAQLPGIKHDGMVAGRFPSVD